MASENAVTPMEHWLLSGVPAAHAQRVIDAGHPIRYLPGDVIFREGDPADGLYLILAGSARVTAVGAGGDAFIAVVKANEVLGELGVLDGEPRSGTATVITGFSGYFLPAEPFLDLLEASTTVCMRLLAILTSRLRTANGRLGELPPIGSVEAGLEVPNALLRRVEERRVQS